MSLNVLFYVVIHVVMNKIWTLHWRGFSLIIYDHQLLDPDDYNCLSIVKFQPIPITTGEVLILISRDLRPSNGCLCYLQSLWLAWRWSALSDFHRSTGLLKIQVNKTGAIFTGLGLGKWAQFQTLMLFISRISRSMKTRPNRSDAWMRKHWNAALTTRGLCS